jgi:hypothetical protein
MDELERLDAIVVLRAKRAKLKAELQELDPRHGNYERLQMESVEILLEIENLQQQDGCRRDHAGSMRPAWRRRERPAGMAFED